MKDIIIIGAGGFGREVACLIHAINEVSPTWNLIGYADNKERIGEDTPYGKIITTESRLNEWKTPLAVVIAIANGSTLKRISEMLTNPLLEFPNIVAPNVTYFDKASINIGHGNIICANSLLSCNISINNFNIINFYSTFGHEVKINSYNIIMPAVNISGGVAIENMNFLGLRSSVLQNIKIGNNVRLGAGSILTRNTKDNNLYIGNPAKILKL